MNSVTKLKLGFIVSSIFVAFLLTSFKAPSADVSIKCLVQLTNYTGEGAYVVVSLLDNNGKYKKTMQVLGREQRWYDDITSWYKHLTTTKENVDGVTGASVKAGGRKVFTITIDQSLIDKGYKLRFETAVENQEYKERDAEVDLTEGNMGKNIKGSGYIRYVKLIKNP